MKKLVNILFFLSLCCLPAFGQTKTNDAILSQIRGLGAAKILVLDYDSSSNVSKIMAFGEDFGSSQNKSNKVSSFSFGMTFSYVGTEISDTPNSFITTFWAGGGKKAGFATAHNLSFSVDGETIEVGEARYATKPGDDREFLNFNFPRDVLVKIVNGKNVEMKMGNTLYKFTPEHMKLFNGLLAISNAGE